jgi:hypothetical protein
MLQAQFSTMDGGTDADEGAVDGPGDAIAASTVARARCRRVLKCCCGSFRGRDARRACALCFQKILGRDEFLPGTKQTNRLPLLPPPSLPLLTRTTTTHLEHHVVRPRRDGARGLRARGRRGARSARRRDDGPRNDIFFFLRRCALHPAACVRGEPPGADVAREAAVRLVGDRPHALRDHPADGQGELRLRRRGHRPPHGAPGRNQAHQPGLRRA